MLLQTRSLLHIRGQAAEAPLRLSSELQAAYIRTLWLVTPECGCPPICFEAARIAATVVALYGTGRDAPSAATAAADGDTTAAEQCGQAAVAGDGGSVQDATAHQPPLAGEESGAVLLAAVGAAFDAFSRLWAGQGRAPETLLRLGSVMLAQV